MRSKPGTRNGMVSLSKDSTVLRRCLLGDTIVDLISLSARAGFYGKSSVLLALLAEPVGLAGLMCYVAYSILGVERPD